MKNTKILLIKWFQSTSRMKEMVARMQFVILEYEKSLTACSCVVLELKASHNLIETHIIKHKKCIKVTVGQNKLLKIHLLM